MAKRKPIVIRKKRKLPPHQYCLRLSLPYEPKIEPPAKAHLIHRGGHWCLYRSKWKSQFHNAAAICAATIPELKQRLSKAHDRYRYGVHP